ncbi:DUF4124 domain-containing protein [Dokdonella sp.]|uniref:DUF4124 domain-containing protein n=1 Tax=Dokdonella sp. TaxID=2291710 RepID=UPI0035289C72
MRAGLFVALLVAVLALFWAQRGRVPDPVRSTLQSQDLVSESPRQVAEVESGGAGRLPVQEAPADAVPSGSESIAAVATAVMHAANMGQACLAGTGSRRPTRAATIHRWVDAAGIVHFSDQAPAQGALQHRRIEVQGLPPVQVDARGVDVNLPDYVVQRATMDAQAIERVIRSSLGMSGDPGLVLNIEYIDSAEIYASRIGSAALAKSDGTYSSADRTIRIRHREDVETGFRVLRHEIVHALMHEHVGNLPTAVNEGLAGFFERLAVSGMGARVVLDTARRRPDAGMSADGQDELVDLLTREGADFYGAGQELRYFRGMALVALLMERVEGRAALSGLIAAQRETPCQPVEAATILDRAYPGGLESLARDWSNWLRNPSERTLSY